MITRGLAASAALIVALTLAACGGESSPEAGSGAGAGLGVGGAGINLADCEDWNDGAVEERFETIRQLREYTGRPVAGTGGRGVVLEDDRAYELFENYCENDFARGFKLYKLYGRAAAFSGASTSSSQDTP